MHTRKILSSYREDGKWVVQVELPTIGQGGTMLLQTEAGDIVNASVQEQLKNQLKQATSVFTLKNSTI